MLMPFGLAETLTPPISFNFPLIDSAEIPFRFTSKP